MRLIAGFTIALLLASAQPALAQSSIPPGQPLRYFGQTMQSPASPTPYGNHASAGRYATAVDGARIYYEVHGTGAPVVVLHGGLVGSLAEMGPLIDQLVGQSYQVIAVNTRGHGKSEVGSADPSYAQKAQDLHHVLRQQGIGQRVRVIGFSDGGYTALHFAAAWPQDTESVVAIGAGTWKKGFRAAAFGMPYEQFTQFDPSFWQQQQAIRPAPDKTPQWYAQVTHHYQRMEIGLPLLSKITVPVLLVSGEKDDNAPLDTVLAAYRILNQRGHPQLAVIAGAPHTVLQANFPAVWANVQPFLAQPAPTPSAP